MKFADDVLVEIVDVVRKGITEGVDVSDLLRDIDVATEAPDPSDGLVKKVCLSQAYKARQGRVV